MEVINGEIDVTKAMLNKTTPVLMKCTRDADQLKGPYLLWSRLLCRDAFLLLSTAFMKRIAVR